MGEYTHSVITGLRPRNLRAVVLCGGEGHRLWPLSRNGCPKPFLPLLAGKSTFDFVIALASSPDLQTPIIVASQSALPHVVESLGRSGLKADVIVEESGRNTAAAIALATEFAYRHDPETELLIMPSDHQVSDANTYNDVLRSTVEVARAGKIAVFGISPSHPASQFGYIKPGPSLAQDALEVSAFVEKPDPQEARKYVREGWLWNAGQFVAQAAVLRRELQVLAPDTWAAASGVLLQSQSLPTTFGSIRHLPPDEAMDRLPPLSFDVAVMERTRLAAVVPLACGWSDLGTWKSLWEFLPKQDNLCVSSGPVVAQNCHSSLFMTEGVQVVAVGLKNISVVATPDSVLVAELDTAQELKVIVDGLRSRPSKTSPVERPPVQQLAWGCAQRLATHPGATVNHVRLKARGTRIIEVPGHHRMHLIVLEGTVQLLSGVQHYMLGAQQTLWLTGDCSFAVSSLSDREALIIETCFEEVGDCRDRARN